MNAVLFFNTQRFLLPHPITRTWGLPCVISAPADLFSHMWGRKCKVAAGADSTSHLRRTNTRYPLRPWNGHNSLIRCPNSMILFVVVVWLWYRSNGSIESQIKVVCSIWYPFCRKKQHQNLKYERYITQIHLKLIRISPTLVDKSKIIVGSYSNS